MGRPAARDRKPYDAALLTDIAMSVFAERGYDGASLEDIASAAGIAKSSVYYHVAGKEDLLARGLERGFRSTFDLLEAEESADGPSIERLRNVPKAPRAHLFALICIAPRTSAGACGATSRMVACDACSCRDQPQG